jgi:hypothetical protein
MKRDGRRREGRERRPRRAGDGLAIGARRGHGELVDRRRRRRRGGVAREPLRRVGRVSLAVEALRVEQAPLNPGLLGGPAPRLGLFLGALPLFGEPPRLGLGRASLLIGAQHRGLALAHELDVPRALVGAPRLFGALSLLRAPRLVGPTLVFEALRLELLLGLSLPLAPGLAPRLVGAWSGDERERSSSGAWIGTASPGRSAVSSSGPSSAPSTGTSTSKMGFVRKSASRPSVKPTNRAELPGRSSPTSPPSTLVSTQATNCAPTQRSSVAVPRRESTHRQMPSSSSR